MSARELTRFTTANDSNIPILKKTIAGAKKSKGCSKLPELQRYIETIIKASNEIDSENASLSDIEKYPKGRQLRKEVVCKGLENKINHEKLKFDVVSNRRKNKRQTSKKYSEAVSRGVEVLHKFFSEFEDPRNWKIRNSGSHLKIEKLIEKFYPNPYTICCENECRNSETQIIFEKVKKDELGDETLFDVFISKIDAETQDDLEKTNFDLVSADFHIMISDRENKTTNDLALSFENLKTITHEKMKNLELKHNAALKLSTTPNTPNKAYNVRHSNSVSNFSSRVSSMESMNQVIYRESQNVNKKINKPNAKVSSKEVLPKVKKLKTLTVVDENDYDLGKLKLLNLSDSDGSIPKNLNTKKMETNDKNNIANDDFVNEISSEICNEISKTNDLNDLLQIYEVMNKATESFLYLTSMKKFENEKPIEATNDPVEDSKPVESSKTRDDLQNDQTKDIKSSVCRTESADEEKTQKISPNVQETEPKPETKPEPESEKIHEEKVEVNDRGKRGRKVEDEIFDANQEINEVLQFMNKCLLKFNNDDEVLQQEIKNYAEDVKIANTSENVLNEEDEQQKTPSTSQTTSSKFADIAIIESTSQTGILNPEEAQLEKTTKNQNARIRCKRKSKILITIPPSVEKEANISQQPANGSEVSTSSFDNAESAVINNDNIVQVAESQNELGSYIEESQISNDDSRFFKKSVLPLSTKARRSLPKTYKTLKDALETEEKLLKLNKPDPQKSDPESQILVRSDAITPVGGFVESMNSNFVLCIRPFNQNLQTSTVVPSLSLPKPLSLSLIDFRSWNLKPLPQEYPTEKVFIPSQTEHRTSKFMYGFKEEILSVVNNTWVTYYARPVCFTAVVGFPKIQKEYSLECSKRQIRVKPFKKFSIVNVNNPGTSGICIRNTVTFTTNKSNILNSTQYTDNGTNITTFDKPVEALIKAIQETENVFLLQQQHNSSGNNSLGHFESFCSCRSHEILKKGTSDNESERDNGKEKVEDLLLRTYKLQKKLQQYLYNITQPARLSRSLIKDLGVTSRGKTPEVSVSDINIQTEKQEDATIDEAVAVNVQMIDRSTTYFPPKEENQKICEKQNDFSCLEKEEGPPLNTENDEDDRSSTYSFKSSNDFSETNEPNEPSGHMTKGDVIKRIFSQIELLKQSVEAENLGRLEKNKMKDGEDKLEEFDPKNPAKVLKTVFKGRKSSTELTIGLKDVPMTKVSNISVEKTKFSPNHTKISICISKENEMNADNSDAKLSSNKVSSYFFDHMRPSLSMCQSEYSKDNVSKSSQSLNEGTDDEEDDYKSVGSTAADSKSGSSSNPEKSKAENQAVVKMSQTKNYTKHKFDFYRKMDMNVGGLKVRQKPLTNSLCRFKELEPLKQALTELQIRMRSIKRDAVLNSNDYYERALKLAKMSAGYCQSCGTRAVIPDDTFGYYKNLLPRRHPQHRRSRHFKTTITPNSSFYSFRSSNAEKEDPENDTAWNSFSQEMICSKKPCCTLYPYCTCLPSKCCRCCPHYPNCYCYSSKCCSLYPKCYCYKKCCSSYPICYCRSKCCSLYPKCYCSTKCCSKYPFCTCYLHSKHCLSKCCSLYPYCSCSLKCFYRKYCYCSKYCGYCDCIYC